MADSYMQLPTTANSSSLLPFLDPQMAAQNQADMLKWQQNQALAQSLMQNQYVPHSGRAGAIGNVLERVMGAIANSRNQDKLSDILTQQFQISNAAAQAQRQQQIQDEYRKMQEAIYEAQQKAVNDAKAKRENPELKVENGFVIDPSNPGASSAIPGYSEAQIALAGGKANAEAAARARYAGAAEGAALGQIQRIMAMPDSPVKQAMLTKALGEGGMQALQMSNMFGGAGGQVSSGPTGDEFLKNLPPAIAGQVKAIAEGRQAPPTSMALRSPMGQQLMAAVTQYDPTFDATNYAARSKTRNDFTSGQASKQVNAMNTAIGHAGALLDAAESLNNTSFPTLNKALNWAASESGDPRIVQFNTTRDALAGELTKAFRGASGSEKDIEEVRNNLSAANSPDQMKAAIGQAMKLLASKNESLADQYSKGFGTKSQPNFLDPHAQAALTKLQKGGIDVGSLGTDEGISTQPTQATPAPTATATGPNGQKIGLVNGQWVSL